MVHHDAEVAGLGAISSVTCRDLPTGLPTLAEAMTACSGMVVNVEIKNSPDEPGFDATGSLAHQVVGALSEIGWLDNVIISSFDRATCAAARLADATVSIGLLTGWRTDGRHALDVAIEDGLTAIHPFFQRVDRAVLDRAREVGVAVNVWTVNLDEEITAMLDFDVDTIITDEPARAIELRRAREQRPR